MTGADDEQRLERTRQRITDWLLAEGWTIKDISDKAEGAAWAIEGTDPRRRVVIFGQGAHKPDALVLQAPITIDETSRKRLAALGRQQNEQLGWEIRFRLLEMGLQFAGLSLPLTRFALVLRVYIDDLGRNGFFERLDRLQAGILAAVWLIRRALDQPAPEDAGTEALDVN